MKHRYLVIPVALTLSATALAHGNHAEVPTDSLLHLLAHHWPLLLLVGALAASWPLFRRNKS